MTTNKLLSAARQWLQPHADRMAILATLHAQYPALRLSQLARLVRELAVVVEGARP